MTTRSEPCVERDNSGTAQRRDPGSVLQALQGLRSAPVREEPVQPPRPRTPAALLPARAGKGRCEPSTGIIDVRAMAALVRRVQPPATQTPPAQPPAASQPPPLPARREREQLRGQAPPPPTPPPASTTGAPPSSRMSLVAAFALGVLCATTVMGALLVRATDCAAGDRHEPPMQATRMELPAGR